MQRALQPRAEHGAASIYKSSIHNYTNSNEIGGEQEIQFINTLALLETLRLHIRPDDLNSVLESGLNALGMAKQAHLQHVVDLHHRLPTCRFEEPVNIFVSAKENILYVYNLTGVCKQSRVKARDAGLHRAASLSMRQRRSTTPAAWTVTCFWRRIDDELQ